MAVKLLTFLGTGKYEPCKYYLDLDGKQMIDDTRFYIQEALLNVLTLAGIKIDEMIIFLTEEARNANWLKNNKCECEPGLKDALTKYKDVRINDVDVPSGKKEDELWEIFDIVLNQIDESDELIFDITHSYRSLPLITIIILNYAKFVKKCKIEGIYYGAHDAKNAETNQAPIFNLTPFAALLNWTTGIDIFINTGDASKILELTKSDAKTMGIKGDRENKKFFEILCTRLSNFVESISTCRGQNLCSSALDLKKAVDDILVNRVDIYIKPIGPLLDILKMRFSSFNQCEYNNILESVRWCLEHELIQQGLTILQEGLITYICDKFNFDRLKYKNNREVVTQAVKIKSENKPYEKWNGSARMNKQKIEQLLASNIFTEDYCKVMRNISNLRNDINHSGWNQSPCSSQKFKNKLEEYLNEARKIMLRSS